MVNIKTKRNRLLLLIFLILCSVIFSVSLSAQEQNTQKKILFEMIPGSKISYREVANLSRRYNNKYIGLLSSVEQGTLLTKDYGNTYQGTFYISRNLKHDARFVEIPIAETVKILMTYNISEGFRVTGESAHPRLQGFPVFPDKAVKPGDSWKAWSTRYVDPLAKNLPTAVKFLCEYTYVGTVEDSGRQAEEISAKYALRYKNEYGNGDPELNEITYAGHDVQIFVYGDTGSMLIIDKIGIGSGHKEVYAYADGTVLEQSGRIITWINAAVIMDKEKIIKDFLDESDENTKAQPSSKPGTEIINLDGEDIEVKQAEEGIKLELKNIHFQPDEAVILDSERHRLDTLAKILKKVPDRTILVIGHTARVGSIENELELSEKRALTIVNELKKRGLPASRFMYEGRGGSEPIGDNSSEEGRKQNRRVEILILED